MNKLFVFNKDNKDHYSEELQLAYQKIGEDKRLQQIQFKELNVDFLISNKIEVVISNGLPKEWFYTFKGLKIVTIIFGDIKQYNNLADIVIDYLSNDSNKYFTGELYALTNHYEIELAEIFNLIEILEWDTNFFGFNIGYLSCRYLTDSIYHQIEQFSKKHKLRLIEYLCNCHDDRSVKTAEKNGFHFTDIRLTFGIKLNKNTSYHVGEGSYGFAKAMPENISSLKLITEGMYKDSRYYYDGNFSIEKLNDFYSGWIEKAVLGNFDDECYCLFDNKKPVGFCSIKYRDGNTASIGLFGIDSDYAGKGLGKTLILHVFETIKEKVNTITVVTQGRNYAAQRLYQSVGFKTESTQLWYHKWIE